MVRIRPKGRRRRFALYLDSETIKALQIEALRQDTSASAVVETLMKVWLKEQQAKGKR